MDIKKENAYLSSWVLASSYFLLYTIIYDPLIISDYFISPLFRLTIEFLLVFYLIFRKFPFDRISIALVIMFVLLVIRVPFSMSNLNNLLSRANKIIIFILLYDYCKKDIRCLKVLKILFLFLSLLTVIQINLGYILYIKLPDVYKINGFVKGSEYPYLGNPFFGNII